MKRNRVYPGIRFAGCDFANTMGIIVRENLVDNVMKVDDGNGDYPKGFMHTSTTPFGTPNYYGDMWSRDAGRGIQELVRYGFIDEAESCVDFALSAGNLKDGHWGRVINSERAEDEVDGNTHMLLAVYSVWKARGKSKELGEKYVEKCMPIFQWLINMMENCPYGYLPACNSELSGNPDTDYKVYAVFPGYGVLVSLKAFSEMAAVSGNDAEAIFKAAADKLADSMIEALVSKGCENHEQWTLVPEGVWLNGLDSRNGKASEMGRFGYAYFRTNKWTRQLPFIQDYDIGKDILTSDKMDIVNRISYEYIRQEMAKGYLFRKYGFVSCTCWEGMAGRHDDTMAGYGQNYMSQAALLNDDVNTYTKCLEGIARLAYDGDIIIPATKDKNPWIMHECFTYENYEQALDHTYGRTGDPTRSIMHNPGDEGNLVQACETLKTIAIVTGISSENDTLVIKPRLPWTWNEMELRDYPVYTADGEIVRINLLYRNERWLSKSSVTVSGAEKFKEIKVRFGPYPYAMSNENELSDRYEIEKTENASWIWKSCKADKVNNIELDLVY